jgi:hypothetical protein
MDTDRGDEILKGHVMDIACIRKAPSAALADRAADHPTDCGLMGHCIESGYGLVGDDGAVRLLDHAATGPVVRHLLQTSTERGVRLTVRRRRNGDAMRTVDVVRGDPPSSGAGRHIQP